MNPSPYRSTVSQYSPKKYSEGPQVPSDPPPSCLFTQSAGESLLLNLPLVFIVSLFGCEKTLRGFLGQRLSSLVCSLATTSTRCGALAPLLRTSSSRRRGKRRLSAPGRRGRGACSSTVIVTRSRSATCWTKQRLLNDTSVQWILMSLFTTFKGKYCSFYSNASYLISLATLQIQMNNTKYN